MLAAKFANPVINLNYKLRRLDISEMTQDLLNNPIFNCEYEILELLGEGMAAEVFLCK